MEFFEDEYFHIEDNWISKRRLICINHIFGQKNFLEGSIFLIKIKFPFQRYNMIDIIVNGLKPVNDKSKYN